MSETATALTIHHQPEPKLRRRWYPMGFAVDIVTSSSDVFAVADKIWSSYPQLSNAPPVELAIDVSSDDAALSPAVPCHHEHFFAMVQNSETFAIADMRSGSAVCKLSRSAVRNAEWFCYSHLEPIAYVLLGAKHFTMIHAACVEIEDRAILLCGPSGAGKTCLAYTCARRGWRFLTGDATQLIRSDPELSVVGRPFSIRFRYSAKAMFPELRCFPATMRPNGKCDLELDTRSLGLAVALKSQAAAVVFLNRDPHAQHASLHSIAQSDAKRLLMEPARIGDAAILAEQEAALDRLLRKPCVRLTYCDTSDAELVLRSLVRVD